MEKKKILINGHHPTYALWKAKSNTVDTKRLQWSDVHLTTLPPDRSGRSFACSLIASLSPVAVQPDELRRADRLKPCMRITPADS